MYCTGTYIYIYIYICMHMYTYQIWMYIYTATHCNTLCWRMYFGGTYGNMQLSSGWQPPRLAIHVLELYAHLDVLLKIGGNVQQSSRWQAIIRKTRGYKSICNRNPKKTCVVTTLPRLSSRAGRLFYAARKTSWNPVAIEPVHWKSSDIDPGSLKLVKLGK